MYRGDRLSLLGVGDELDRRGEMPDCLPVALEIEVNLIHSARVVVRHARAVGGVVELIVLDLEGSGGVGLLVVIDIAGDLAHVHGAAYEARQANGHARMRQSAAKLPAHVACKGEEGLYLVDALGLGEPAHAASDHEQRVEEQQARHGKADNRQTVVVGCGTVDREALGDGASGCHAGVVSRQQINRPVHHEDDEEHERESSGNARGLEEGLAIGLAPAQQRADREDRKVDDADGSRDGVVGAGGDRLAAKGHPTRQRLGDGHVRQQAGKHDEHEVVEVVGDIAAEHALDLIILGKIGAKTLPAQRQADDTGDDGEHDEREEERQ